MPVLNVPRIALSDDILFAAFEAEAKKMSEMHKGQPSHGLHFSRAVNARLWPSNVTGSAP
jgi:hypothetical protein